MLGFDVDASVVLGGVVAMSSTAIVLKQHGTGGGLYGSRPCFGRDSALPGLATLPFSSSWMRGVPAKQRIAARSSHSWQWRHWLSERSAFVLGPYSD